MGSAEVVVRAIATKVKSDIRKAFQDARPAVKAEGKAAGQQYMQGFKDSFSSGISGAVEKGLGSAGVRNAAESGGKDTGRAFNSSFTGELSNLDAGGGLKNAIDGAMDQVESSAREGAKRTGSVFEREMGGAGRRGGNGFASGFISSGFMKGADAASQQFTMLLAKSNILGPAIGALVGALSAAASGLFAIASAAAQAIPAFAVLPGLLAPLIQGLLTVTTAMKGVGAAIGAGMKPATAAVKETGTAARDAQQAVSDAARALGRAQQDAARQIGEARQSLSRAYRDAAEAAAEASQKVADAIQEEREANRDLLDAQREMNFARKEAIEQLQQLSFSAEDAALGEERAALRLEDAHAKLVASQSLPVDDRARREAELGFKEAELAFREAKDRNADTAKEAKKAAKAGVEGTDVVVDARKKVGDAEDRVQDAVRNTAEANRDQAKQAVQNAESIHDAQDALNQAQLSGARSVADAQLALAKAHQRVGDATKEGVKAADAYQTALDGLSKPAQKFVEYMVSIQDEFKSLRAAAGKELFPRLQEAMEGLVANVFPRLRTAMTETGKLMGDAALGFSNVFDPKAGLEGNRLAEVLRKNNEVLAIFTKRGPKGENFVSRITRLFLRLSVAINPVTKRFANWINTLSIGAEKSTRSETSMKRLTKFFNKAGDRAALLGKIFGNLFGILGNLGKAADPAGESLLESFEKATEKLEKFTGSKKGQKKLKKFFEDVAYNVRQVSNLLVTVGDEFLSLGDNRGVGDLAGKLEPAVKNIGDISDKLIEASPALGEFATQITELMEHLTEAGQIQMFIDNLTWVIEKVNEFAGSSFGGWLLGIAAKVASVTRVLALFLIIGGFLFKALIGGPLKAGKKIFGLLKFVGRLGGALKKLFTGKPGEAFKALGKGSDSAKDALERQMSTDKKKIDVLERLEKQTDKTTASLLRLRDAGDSPAGAAAGQASDAASGAADKADLPDVASPADAPEVLKDSGVDKRIEQMDADAAKERQAIIDNNDKKLKVLREQHEREAAAERNTTDPGEQDAAAERRRATSREIDAINAETDRLVKAEKKQNDDIRAADKDSRPPIPEGDGGGGAPAKPSRKDRRASRRAARAASRGGEGGFVSLGGGAKGAAKGAAGGAAGAAGFAATGAAAKDADGAVKKATKGISTNTAKAEGSVKKSTGKMSKHSKVGAKAGKALGGGFKAMGGGLVALGGPIGIILLLIPVFIMLFKKLYKESPAFRKFVDGIVDKLKLMGQWFKEKIMPIIEKFFVWVNENLPKVGKVFKKVFAKIGDAVGWAIGFIKKHWKTILAIIGGPIVALVIVIASNFGRIKTFFKGLWTRVKGVVNSIKEKFGEFRETIARVIGRVIRTVERFKLAMKILKWRIQLAILNIRKDFHALKEKIHSVIVNFIQKRINNFKNNMRNLKERIASAINNIKKKFTEVKDKIHDVIVNFIQKRITNFKNNMTSLRERVRDVINAVKTKWEELRTKIKDIKDWLDTKINAIKTKFGEIRTAIANAFSGIGAKAKEGINAFLTFLNTKLIAKINKVTSKFGMTIPTIKLLAEGGPVKGRGGPKEDNHLAALSAGEYVVKNQSVRAIGERNMDYMNRYGRMPGTGGRGNLVDNSSTGSNSRSSVNARSTKGKGGWSLPSLSDLGDIFKAGVGKTLKFLINQARNAMAGAGIIKKSARNAGMPRLLYGVMTSMANSAGNWGQKKDDAEAARQAAAAAAGSASAGGHSGARGVWNALRTAGFSKIHAAGIMGNIQSESGFYAQRVQGNGLILSPDPNRSGGYGLVQWTPGTKLGAYLKGKTPTISNEINVLKKQLAGQGPHGEGAAGRALRATKTVEAAAEAFLKKYERPKDPSQANRATQARAWYNKFKGVAIIDQSAAEADGGGGGGGIPGGGWVYPLGRRYGITQGGGGRHNPANAVDIGSPTGTAVLAASAGIIETVRDVGNSSYGRYIRIQHQKGVQTLYAHLLRFLVHTGQRVRKGQKIALSNNTGGSSGPHLHFELNPSSSTIDAMRARGVRLAKGGIVPATPGGILAMIGEAGSNERVEPLGRDGFSARDRAMIDLIKSSVSQGGDGGGTNIHVYPSRGMNEIELANLVSRRIAWKKRPGT